MKFQLKQKKPTKLLYQRPHGHQIYTQQNHKPVNKWTRFGLIFRKIITLKFHIKYSVTIYKLFALIRTSQLRHTIAVNCRKYYEFKGHKCLLEPINLSTSHLCETAICFMNSQINLSLQRDENLFEWLTFLMPYAYDDSWLHWLNMFHQIKIFIYISALNSLGCFAYKFRHWDSRYFIFFWLL